MCSEPGESPADLFFRYLDLWIFGGMKEQSGKLSYEGGI
jgi:hypothetical protein